MKKAALCVLISMALIMSFGACQAGSVSEQTSVQQASPETEWKGDEKLKLFSDIRYLHWLDGSKQVYEADEFSPEDISTFTFNEGTVLKGSEELAAQTMEAGKNPGLGIRSLHQRGITGKGVNVAIIDQNLLLHHPEFDGKIAAYYDTGCERPEDDGSMHAPAVTSILVGDSIGVAPDAKVYFAASPSWKKDSKYYADALYWIIEQNKKLPEGEKIRVVSVSAAPSGSPFEKNIKMWDKAASALKEEGILLLDCGSDPETSFIYPAYYDPQNPEDVSKCKYGFPSSPTSYQPREPYIGVPTSYRTVAEEYKAGSPSYQYTGVGGLSWGIPYAAGVLALGWQVDPTLSNEEIIQLLFDTCGTGADGSTVINPAAFIASIEKRVK